MSARCGSVCTGYGGLDMAAAELLDVEPVWFADNDPAASKVLAHHWPGVPNLGDITAVDWAAVEPVEVLTGGTPCQDLSTAGKRAGMRHDTRSGLWHAMCEAIEVLRPRLVLWENVRGALSAKADSAVEPCPGCLGAGDDRPPLRALGRVLGDLATLGYDTVWCCLPAAAVGCAHLRWRVFLAATDTGGGRATDAHADGGGWDGRSPLAEPTRRPGWGEVLAGGGARPVADAAGARRGRVRSDHVGRIGGEAVRRWEEESGRRDRVVADPEGDRRDERGTELPGQQGRGDVAVGGVRVAADTPDRDETYERQVGATPGSRRRRVGGEPGAGAGVGAGHPAAGVRELGGSARSVDFGGYEPAIQRWESILGRPAPIPTAVGQRGSRVLNPVFVEWMMGLDPGHVTGVDGLSRNDMLRLCGNGVVRQQAIAAYRYLLPLLAEGRSAA